MKIRQKLSTLALCFLMLMSLTPLGVHAEEKLIKADVGVFTDGELVGYNLSGIIITDSKYKYILKEGDNYSCSDTSTGLSYSGTDMDTILENAPVYKKNDTICLNYAEVEGSKLLVYSDSNELKYEIDSKDLSKYCENTTTNHTVSVSLKSAMIDSEGQVIGNTYSFTGVGISRVNIYTDEDNYATYSNSNSSSSPFNVDFVGTNGTYTYEAVMEDGFVATGTLSQVGVSDPGNVSQNNRDELNASMGKVEEVKDPTVTLSKIPKKKCTSFKLTIKSDIDAQFNFNGQVSDGYKKEATFTVDSNGTLFYSATTAESGYTEGTIKVNCIKDDTVDAEVTDWSPNDWTGSSSSKGSSNNLVQTGLFDNFKFFRYIGAFLVVIGIGILVAKKKGFSFKKGEVK